MNKLDPDFHRGGRFASREAPTSNCLIFALMRFWRRGGYVVMMWSKYGWWPHWVWTEDLATFHEFSPISEKYRGMLCPPVIFRGRIKRWKKDD